MKRVIKQNLVITMLMLTVFIGYANEGNITFKDEITNVNFDYVKNGSVLSIKDENGLILYKETIQKSGNYSKGFDLTELPDGKYFFELDKDVEISVIPFEVSNTKVTFNKEKESIIRKPILVTKKGVVYLSKLSVNNEPMEVTIYHENDKVYAEKLQEDSYSIGRAYDFSTSKKGEYRIVMETEGRQFVKNIKI
ncbi:MAG: hypothetical protein R2821_11825 [Flavobacteriaceae bacterium]